MSTGNPVVNKQSPNVTWGCGDTWGKGWVMSYNVSDTMLCGLLQNIPSHLLHLPCDPFPDQAVTHCLAQLGIYRFCDPWGNRKPCLSKVSPSTQPLSAGSWEGFPTIPTWWWSPLFPTWSRAVWETAGPSPGEAVTRRERLTSLPTPSLCKVPRPMLLFISSFMFTQAHDGGVSTFILQMRMWEIPNFPKISSLKGLPWWLRQ